MEYDFAGQVHHGTLNAALSALALPNFVGTARLSRRHNSETDQWESSPPYLLIKCGELTRRQDAAVKAIVDAHDASIAQALDPEQVRLARVTELLRIPRSDWTASQRTELLELIARGISR